MTTHTLGTVAIGAMGEFGPRFATEARLGGLCFGIHSIETAMTRDEAAKACRIANAAPDLLAALQAMWAFASRMVERHGMDGDDTMTDEEHAIWQDAAGATNHAIAKATGA